MNFIKQITTFLTRSAYELDSNEVNVYMRLFYINNTLAWREWFQVTNRRLMNEAGIGSEATLTRIKKSLQEKGYILFESGRKKEPTKYKIIPLDEISTSASEVKPVVKPVVEPVVKAEVQEISTSLSEVKPVVKPIVKEALTSASEVKPVVEPVVEPEVINKLIKTKHIAAAAANDTGENSNELQEAIRIFSDNIHPLSGEIELDMLTELVDKYHLTWVSEAITEAALNNGRSLKYISAILQRWEKDGFKTKRGTDNGGNENNQNGRGSVFCRNGRASPRSIADSVDWSQDSDGWD